jgi:cyclopropane fatty-acyl-phospholipid synthase-like methyltransferase
MEIFHEIKTMKLYTNIDRIKNELEQRGLLDNEYIDPIELSEIDSMHYMGRSVMDDIISTMSLTKTSTVLNVGSGFGGTARLLSTMSQCQVTALELQEDIHDIATFLTKKCKLDDHIKHVTGDILDLNLDEIGGDGGGGTNSYDGLVSLLVFLHIEDKTTLLQRCASMLKPGGTIFIEDYYRRSSFTDEENKRLTNDVYAFNLPTREEYMSHLETAGFTNIQFIDKTSDWTYFVHDQLFKFMYNQVYFEEVHDKPTYNSLLHFYNSVALLFSGQNLGGVRIIAQKLKPSEDEI